MAECGAPRSPQVGRGVDFSAIMSTGGRRAADVRSSRKAALHVARQNFGTRPEADLSPLRLVRLGADVSAPVRSAKPDVVGG